MNVVKPMGMKFQVDKHKSSDYLVYAVVCYYSFV